MYFYVLYSKILARNLLQKKMECTTTSETTVNNVCMYAFE